LFSEKMFAEFSMAAGSAPGKRLIVKL
jgi:hypothetical protein